MAHIYSRSDWNAQHKDGDITITGLAVAVVIHHSTHKTLSPNASVNEEIKEMQALDNVGRARFGHGISYNCVIFPSGRPYQGVSWNRRGTHTGGHNSTVRSICFAGNFENSTPTAAALNTAREIIAEGRGKWWIKNAPVRGHRDYKATACPGKNVYSQLKYLAGGTTPVSKPSTPKPPVIKPPAPAKPAGKTVAQLADEVIAGKHGNGDQRVKSLGAQFSAVQAEVNRRLSGKVSKTKPAGKTVTQMATEVIQGKHGNGHAKRRKSLGINAATYTRVRAEVNRRAR